MTSVDVDAELALIERHGVHLRRLGTPEYPASLACQPGLSPSQTTTSSPVRVKRVASSAESSVTRSTI